MRLFILLIAAVTISHTAMAAEDSESKRQYSLSGSISLGNDDDEITVAGSASKSKSTKNTYNLAFGWNKKKFEFGPFLRANFEKDTSDNSEFQDTTLGGFFEYNFKENDGKEKIIPYIGAGFGIVTAKLNDGTSSYTGDGTHYNIHLGLKYFVVQDFGFKFEYEIGKTDVKVDSNVDQLENVKFDASILSAGLIGYF